MDAGDTSKGLHPVRVRGQHVAAFCSGPPQLDTLITVAQAWVFGRMFTNYAVFWLISYPRTQLPTFQAHRGKTWRTVSISSPSFLRRTGNFQKNGLEGLRRLGRLGESHLRPRDFDLGSISPDLGEANFSWCLQHDGVKTFIHTRHGLDGPMWGKNLHTRRSNFIFCLH